ncbi:DUF3418 domain-containing protein [Actinomycetaceae bacterium MB13-C1-2]|nr:DUF3418 domain-containing protein [Actinomycetaceae bacterium MB13-C1-2]
MSYPDLPVSEHRGEIAEAIKNHQVVIVSGETGSGKTTQLPKICLEIGRGIAGMIGHTQPRRIAARAVAERIADELETTVGRDPGDIIGYQVRFTDEVGPTTLIKLMTDGILLAEIGTDPLLRQYDTIIVDEAHERSLNIDFILGYLATLLTKRPDLKVIITSATIDSARFAQHFSSVTGDEVPVIEVSGRAYPVEVRYRPLSADLAPARTGTESAPNADDVRDGPPGASNSDSESASDEEKLSQVSRAGGVGTQLQPEQDGGDLPELGYGLGEDIDLETALTEAVAELLDEPEGDILVFLPGERDIREAEQALVDALGPRYVKDEKRPHRPDGIEVVPLYARLSAAEQHRIYAPHSLRRVVLSTNIAETSLTVPGVRYVIDSGLARISRFSNKTKVQRLPIERISQASAAQRAGRAGRVAPGVAIRLYSERDHLHQSEFTEPEILRTSLASVILQMSVLGLGAVAEFPFLDRPNSRAVRDGVQLLMEIGALDEDEHVTALGRRLARLPIDPRLGRMLIEADKLGCASEVLVIVAALSIQDVRERPLDRVQQADQAHARFADRSSDFITYLNMWRYLSVMSRDLSGSAFRRLCKAEYFHYLRYREWRDIVGQIRRMCQQLGINVAPIGIPSPREVAAFRDAEHPAVAAVIEFGEGPGSVSADEVHRAVLSGLLSNIGNWDEVKHNYQGARGSRFTIWPGSALRRRTPGWVMAAELVETSRLFARTVAAIKPEWIEEYAGPLMKRSYSEPIWSRAKGSATVKERVTLYGLTLAADRQVPLTQLGDTPIGRTYLGEDTWVTARSLAHDMFISNALVDGDWREGHHAFVRHNQQVMDEATELSNRLRDPSLVPDEAVRYRFFDARIPAKITSAASFNRWWKDKRRSEPDLLDYSLGELLPAGAVLDPDGFPDTWKQGELEFPVSYSFDPGDKQDGVTVTIPLRVLQGVRDEGFDWLVPGLQRDLCIAMVRGLPKAKRRLLAPAQQHGEAIWQRMVDEREGRTSTAANVQDAGAEPEADPYSLEASLDRLRNWGSSGTVRQTKNAIRATRSDSETSRQSASVRDGAGQSSFSVDFGDGSGETSSALDRRLVAGRDFQAFAPAAQSESVEPISSRLELAEVPSSSAAVEENGLGEAAHAPGSAGQSGASEPFMIAFARAVRNSRGIELSQDDLRQAQNSLPSHLRVGFRVVDDMGAIIGASDSLADLQKRFKRQVDQIVDAAVKGALATAARGQAKAKKRRAKDLLVQTTKVPKDQLEARAEQDLVRRLLEDLRLDQTRVTTRWTGREALLLAASPYPNTAALVEDAQRAAMADLVRELLPEGGALSIQSPGADGRGVLSVGAIGGEERDNGRARMLEASDTASLEGRSEDSYQELRSKIRDRLEDRVYEVLGGVVRSAEAFAQVQDALQNHQSESLKMVLRDTKRHSRALFANGYLTYLPWEVRQHLPRYLQADARRIEAATRAPQAVKVDAERMSELNNVIREYEAARAHTEARPYSRRAERELEEVRMLIEELRVSLFAQSLGTSQRVSATRIRRRLEAME